MKNRIKVRNAHPTGTSRGSAKLRHRGITKNCDGDAQRISDFSTDKVCGNFRPQEENFEPYESRVARSLRTNFNDQILKTYTPKLVNEWDPVPEYEYCSRQQVAWANRVGCDY